MHVSVNHNWVTTCFYNRLLDSDMQDPGCPYYSDTEDEKAAKGSFVLL